jgi:hypothetical protein
MYDKYCQAKDAGERKYILFKYLGHRTGLSQRVKTRDYLMFPKSRTLDDFACPRLKFDLDDYKKRIEFHQLKSIKLETLSNWK